MKKCGVLIISHGSRDAAWVAHVDDTIEAAKTTFYRALTEQNRLIPSDYDNQFPIISSYLELVEGRLIQDGINKLQDKGVTHIHVLPLFVSAGSTHVEEIKQAFGFRPSHDFIGDLEPLKCHCTISFDMPLIDDDEIIDILNRQLIAFQIDDPTLDAVLVLGHGSTDKTYFRLWEQGMKQLIAKLEINNPALTIEYAALLPEGSRAKLDQLRREYNQVVVIPLFISAGYFTQKIIPSRLNGQTYIYSGETLLPSDEMVKLLINRFKRLYIK